MRNKFHRSFQVIDKRLSEFFAYNLFPKISKLDHAAYKSFEKSSEMGQDRKMICSDHSLNFFTFLVIDKPFSKWLGKWKIEISADFSILFNSRKLSKFWLEIGQISNLTGIYRNKKFLSTFVNSLKNGWEIYASKKICHKLPNAAVISKRDQITHIFSGRRKWATTQLYHWNRPPEAAHTQYTKRDFIYGARIQKVSKNINISNEIKSFDLQWLKYDTFYRIRIEMR